MSKNALVVIGTYNNVEIHARPEDRYVDATDLCLSHRCEWSKFVRLECAKRFITALSANLQIPEDRLVIDGAREGRYGRPHKLVHPHIALRLAAWISPDFEVWVYARINELLTTGTVSLPRSDTSRLEHLIEQVLADNAQLRAENVQFRTQLAQLTTMHLGAREVGLPMGIRERVHERRPGLPKYSPLPAKVVARVKARAFRNQVPVFQLVKNGPLMIDQVHLRLVDEEIQRVLDEADSRQTFPLFDGGSAMAN